MAGEERTGAEQLTHARGDVRGAARRAGGSGRPTALPGGSKERRGSDGRAGAERAEDPATVGPVGASFTVKTEADPIHIPLSCRGVVPLHLPG